MQISRADMEVLASMIAKEVAQILASKPTTLHRWLKLRDAAQYSSIGEHKLKALAGKGIIRGFKDPDSNRRDWIFDRDTLDDYRLGQAGNEPTIKERVNALMAGIKL